MNSERSASNRVDSRHGKTGKFLRASGNLTLFGFTVFLSQALFHPQNENILNSISGEKIDCSNGVESLDNRYPYDVIAVPGGGLHINDKGEHEINFFEARRLRAAAMAYVNGYAKRVILLDGVYSEGINPNITKDILKTQVKELSNGEVEIFEEDIFVDTVSIDTASNMHELSKFMRKEDLNNALLITDGFHIRAELWACSNNINASWLSVEEMEALYNPAGIYEIEAPNRAEDVWKRDLSENLKALGIMFDPTNGYLTTEAKKILINIEK